MHIIVRPPDHPVLRRIVEVHRQRCGYAMIPKWRALAASLKALRRGEIVVVLMDQSSLRHAGIPVEFFGAKAYTTIGPAVLALRTGCPVVSGFLVRQAPGQHRMIFSREIPVCRTGNLQYDIEQNTRVFTHVIETYVRRYPDHWFWLHRRWKERPG
jgi:KDO2-lipid IV(A) lauroyltransferase